MPPSASMIGHLIKRVGILAIGTAAGQLFVLAATPYLARIYSPADFGQLALLLSITNIFLTIGCLRYDLALPSAEEKDIPVLQVLCCGIAISWSFFVFVLTSFPWYRWIHHPVIYIFQQRWLLATLFIGAGFYQITGTSFIQAGRFSKLALIRSGQGILYSAIGFFPGMGLLIAQGLSYFLLGIISLCSFSLKQQGITFRQLFETSKKYRKFPMFSLPGALLDVLAYSACVWIITHAYGLYDAGLYGQLQRLVGAPLMLISISLSQVMLKHTADLHRDGHSLRPTILKLSKILGVIGIVLVMFCFFMGVPLLKVILGSQWRTTPYFIAAIAFAASVRAIVSPMSSVLVTKGKLNYGTMWQAIYFISSWSVLSLISKVATIDQFVFGYAVHEAVLYAVYFMFIMKAARD